MLSDRFVCFHVCTKILPRRQNALVETDESDPDYIPGYKYNPDPGVTSPLSEKVCIQPRALL